MLYRMLTGRLPFESSDPMELVMLHRDPAAAGDRAPRRRARIARVDDDRGDREGSGRSPCGRSRTARRARRADRPLGVHDHRSPPATHACDARASRCRRPRAPPAQDAFGAAGGPPPRRNRVPLLVVGLLALLLAGAASHTS